VIGTFGLALIIAFGSARIWAKDTGQELDLWLLSRFFHQRGPRPLPNDIVIVSIDDESYVRLREAYPDYERRLSPRWPFPRRFEAEALENIIKAKPRAIIIDLRFAADADDPAADARIEEALRTAPTSIWSGKTPQPGSDFRVSDGTQYVTLPSELRFRAAAKMQLDMLIAGHFGVFARLTLDDRPEASLYERVPLARPLVELAQFKVEAPGRFDLINFYGPPQTIPRIPLYRLVGERAGDIREKLQGKVVLFGFLSATRGLVGNKDAHPIPGSDDLMPGTEIHATIAANLVDRTWLHRYPTEVEVQSIFLAALLLSLCGVALPFEKGAPLVAALVAAATWLSYLAFAHFFVWLPGLPVVAAAALIALLCGAVRHNIGLRRFKGYLKRTFGFELERKL
jgi:CHASE2 domain-containing sensor protein